MGSFGGTYYRPIRSSITGKSYRDVWREFPAGEPEVGDFSCLKCKCER